MTAELAPDAVWVIDDTGFPKRGHHSVGVQRHFSGTLSKTGNCQVAMSLPQVRPEEGTILVVGSGTGGVAPKFLRGSVSSPRHITRSVRISRPTRSCTLRDNGYGADRVGVANARYYVTLELEEQDTAVNFRKVLPHETMSTQGFGEFTLSLRSTRTMSAEGGGTQFQHCHTSPSSQ